MVCMTNNEHERTAATFFFTIDEKIAAHFHLFPCVSLYSQVSTFIVHVSFSSPISLLLNSPFRNIDGDGADHLQCPRKDTRNPARVLFIVTRSAPVAKKATQVHEHSNNQKDDHARAILEKGDDQTSGILTHRLSCQFARRSNINKITSAMSLFRLRLCPEEPL